MKNTFTQADLVIFGNYLLSEQREQSIKNKENIKEVHQEDLDNFEVINPTDEDVIRCIKEQLEDEGYNVN